MSGILRTQTKHCFSHVKKLQISETFSTLASLSPQTVDGERSLALDPATIPTGEQSGADENSFRKPHPCDFVSIFISFLKSRKTQVSTHTYTHRAHGFDCQSKKKHIKPPFPGKLSFWVSTGSFQGDVLLCWVIYKFYISRLPNLHVYIHICT